MREIYPVKPSSSTRAKFLGIRVAHTLQARPINEVDTYTYTLVYTAACRDG